MKPTIKRFVPLFALAALAVLCAGAARAVPVEITVLGPDGAPVAGASVLPRKAGAALLATDGGGRVAVDADPALGAPGELGVATVYAPGFVVAELALRQTGNVLRLVPAVPVKGRVCDVPGRPVAGTTVRLFTFIPPYSAGEDRSSIAIPAEIVKKLAATTGADGSWSLDGAPVGAMAIVGVDDPRFARSLQFVLPEGTGKTLIVYRAAAVTGRVRYEDGRPAPGVQVAAQGERNVLDGGDAVTGADGIYRLERLPPERIHVALNDESGEWVAVARPVVTVEGDTVAAPDLVLQKGSLIEGTVTDAATGKPMADVIIRVRGPHQPLPDYRTTTDTAGAYRVRVAPGENALLPWPGEGYLGPGEGAEETVVTLAPSETKTVPLTLKKTLTVAGTAVDEAGQPVAGAKLSLSGNHYRREAVTDEKGRWSVGDLVPGTYEIRSLQDDWPLVSPREVTLPEEVAPVVKLSRVAK